LVGCETISSIITEHVPALGAVPMTCSNSGG
jgi:hypothetical protein